MMTMTICSNKSHSAVAYSTLCGQYHKKRRESNQDAVAVKMKNGCSVFCVADGVGSQKFARWGSRAVVKAVIDTFEDFADSKIEKKKITATIFERYKEYVKEKYRSEASTTCAFVAITQNDGLFIGQVGDGLCYVKINGERVFITDNGDAFLNEVSALSAVREKAVWKTKHFDILPSDSIEVLLATDGVSGDIIPGKEDECLKYFLRKTSCHMRFAANKKLKTCLKQWGETGSNDDKTVIVYKREVISEREYSKR